MDGVQSGAKLKVGYFADGRWAHEAFKLLSADPAVAIVFVCVRFDSQDEVLSAMARERGLPVLKHPNINAPDFLAKMRESGCDLLVSMSFNQIFRAAILAIPPMGIINCHAGKLPFYRGRNILNWVLINDEKEFGITVHHVDEGIDTGDILAQETHPITDEDDYGTLLDRAVEGCARLLYATVTSMRKGEAKRRRQSDIHPVGFYCGMRKAGDERLDWSRPSREVWNFIRAIRAPGPGARTLLEGREVRIDRARLIPGAPDYRGVPGMVVGRSPSGFTVKTGDSTLEITEYGFEGKIKVGDRLQ